MLKCDISYYLAFVANCLKKMNTRQIIIATAISFISIVSTEEHKLLFLFIAKKFKFKTWSDFKLFNPFSYMSV